MSMMQRWHPWQCDLITLSAAAVMQRTMGKAKPAHHTTAELKAKARAATINAGGGKSGLQDRKGGAVGHQKFKCNVCAQTGPDMKTMQIHFEAKHPKLPWADEQITDLHALAGGVTTQVRRRAR